METPEPETPVVEKPEEAALMVLLPDTKEGIEKSGKFPILKQDLVDFVAQYKDLKIVDVNDKEGYKAMDAARKALKGKRTLITSTGKMTRDFANKYCKAVIELEKSLVEIVSPLEEDFVDRLDEIDAEREKIREEEQRKEDDRIQDMQNLLRNVGADMDIYELKAITPERFELVLQEATQAFETKKAKDEERRVQEEKEEAERQKQAEITRMAEEKRREQEREELRLLTLRQEAERKKLEEQQRIQDKAKEELLAAQRELAETKAKMEAEKVAMAKAKLDQRVKRFKDIGYIWTGFSAIYQVGERSAKIEVATLQNATEAEFETAVDLYIKRKANIDKEVEEERQAEIERQKQAAIETERKRAEEEAESREQARLKAEAESREKLMQGEDADRFLYLASELDALVNDGVFGAMQSQIGKDYAGSILQHLNSARDIAVKRSAKPKDEPAA